MSNEKVLEGLVTKSLTNTEKEDEDNEVVVSSKLNLKSINEFF